ncbi:hypothetical protein RIF29_18957 [Crotalaria pallida]|uniref:F-box domain-containing protein n=1 Tax=Crotalaria pallida TaxID=3830 RepID=A0AAN9F0E9_CROPI
MSIRDLPDDCWVAVFKWVDQDRDFEPLSLVSKRFLSITNHLRSSLVICDKTLLPRLLARFPNLSSLNLTRFPRRGDAHALLSHISHSHLPLLTCLNLSGRTKLPLHDGVRKIETLKSLICSCIGPYKDTDFVHIVRCFPMLQELDITYPVPVGGVSDDAIKSLALGLPKLNKERRP